GQRGQDLPVGGREQVGDVVLERADVLEQDAVASKVPGQSRCSLLSVVWRRQTSPPPVGPVLRVGSVSSLLCKWLEAVMLRLCCVAW
ncbi:MAG TPA: hypothetical protein VH419_00315, partial [Nocardioidaceae bacterium]